MTLTIWHNPRCSKSRQTLKLLRDRGIEVDVVEYLKSPPSEEEITDVLKRLGIKAKDLIRANEAAYREEAVDQLTDESELVSAMSRYPILIERPIVLNGELAAIGRPPENVLKIL